MSQHIKHTPIHGDGCKPIERVRRLPTEPELADYDWDPETGNATFTYEREIETCDGLLTHEEKLESITVVRAQPSGRWHPGWRMWNGRFTTERY